MLPAIVLPAIVLPAIVPLAIDLDGTLSVTDTLAEQLIQLVMERPLTALRLLPVAAGPVAGLKRRVAAAVPVDPRKLVYDPLVLGLAQEAKDQRRPVLLVTASDAGTAEAVAAHLGCFDEAFGSDGVLNLEGATKALFLRERYGAGGYDYVADSRADIAVWQSARRAILVRAGTGTERLARGVCDDVSVLVPAPGRAATLVRAMRVHQWAKNLLVFVPALAAHRLSTGVLGAGLLAFAAFSLCASSVYLLNDLADLPHDRAHPAKCRRPFASGALPLAWAPGLIAALLAAGLAIALALPARFGLLLLGYYTLTLAYSLVLKRRMVWDVMTLAGLYTVRVFAGGAATGIPVSPWLLAFAMFLFFCLAVVKRTTELVRLTGAGGEASAGRGYIAQDLDMLRSMAAASGTMSVLVLALYIDSSALLPLYRHPLALWALCPVLLFWVSRVLMLSNRGLMNEDPVVFALTDRVSLAAGAAALAAVLAGAS